MDKKQFTVEKRWLSRLFTTFAMILLIVFVLSTATFAWYSVANVAGTAGDVAFKAGSMQEGEGGDLCIAWNSNSTNSYSISFTDATGLQPMIPINDGVIGTTSYKDFYNFNKATQTLNSAFKFITKIEDDSICEPFVLHSANDETVFYLINKGETALNVVLDYSISSGDVNTSSYVKYFLYYGETNESYEYGKMYYCDNGEYTLVNVIEISSFNNITSDGSSIYLYTGETTEEYVNNKYYIYNDIEGEWNGVYYQPVSNLSEIVNKFRCAFFTYNAGYSDLDGSGAVLRGIMSNSSNIHYGELEEGVEIYETGIMANAYRETEQIVFSIPANSFVGCRALAWFDGVEMTEANSQESVLLNLSFVGTIE